MTVDTNDPVAVDAHNRRDLWRDIISRLDGVAEELGVVQGLLDDVRIYPPVSTMNLEQMIGMASGFAQLAREQEKRR